MRWPAFGSAVPAPMMAMLTEHLAAWGLTGADVDTSVFQAPGGGPLRYSNWLRRVWHPACLTWVGAEGLEPPTSAL